MLVQRTISKNSDFRTFVVFAFLALPDGWFRFGSKLLKFFKERKTWGQAQNICQALGGGLASIHSERENEFMFEMFVKNLTNFTKPGFKIRLIFEFVSI